MWYVDNPEATVVCVKVLEMMRSTDIDPAA